MRQIYCIRLVWKLVTFLVLLQNVLKMRMKMMKMKKTKIKILNLVSSFMRNIINGRFDVYLGDRSSLFNSTKLYVLMVPWYVIP